tara:strand:+ start:664 stop:822 length:159 start_codon:yes stop_codon:yes gene_type:complete
VGYYFILGLWMDERGGIQKKLNRFSWDFTMENFGVTLFLKTVIFPDFLLELF